MRRLTLLLIAVFCVLTRASILVAQSPPLTPFRGLIDHVSVDQSGFVPYENVEIWHRAISGDGRYVVMNSPSSTLATGDYNDDNWLDDIFIRDRMTGTTTRISRSSDGGSGDGISQYGTISTNGRHVAFASGSTNLVPGDTNNHWDVFVRDFDQQLTVRVSVATDGTQGDRDAYYPSLSADGRFVAFVSWATTFAPGVSSSSPRQVYLHDRDADGDAIFDEPGEVTTELISVGFTGGIADDSVDTPRVSSDGRHVLFESAATNLSDVGNPNSSNHLYLRDRLTGETALIDRAVTGGPSSWGVGWGTSDMSDDGRFITFSSISPDIVWFDMNWQSQAFLYDTVAGPAGTTIVSRLPDGTIGDGSSYASSVNADGRFVVFTTSASNLASPPPGASGPAMLAVRDTVDGSIARVDVLDSGDAFDQSDYYYTAAVSADGTAIVLQSRSQIATGGAFTGASHAFVLTALSVSPALASHPMAGGSGSIEVNTSAVTGWNAVSLDPWIVLNGSGAGAGPGTVQYEVASNDAGIVRDGYIRIGSQSVRIHQEGDGDTTPPVITPIVTGTQVNGWYTSDISVQFTVSDPDSEIVSLGYGCTQTYTFTTDFLYAAPMCEATSHGGPASVSVPLRRDTTPPVISIVEPKAGYYAFGTSQWPAYSCSDAHSGAASCDGPYQGSPFDTITRGRNLFTVTSTDEAGNTAAKNVEYLVGTDVCVSSPLAPGNLKRWWRFEGILREFMRGDETIGYFAPGTFPNGVAGQSWDNTNAWNFFWGQDPPSAVAGAGLTVAMWVKPRGVFSPTQEYSTLVYNPMQYHVARWRDGTLRWAFNQSGTYTWVNTGVSLPSQAWSHIAVTYKDGVVRTYHNGLPVHSQTLGEPLGTGPYTQGIQIAGRTGLMNSLNGSLDDLMIFDEALPASEIDSLALAGSGSLCIPFASNLALTVPPTVAPGGQYFQVTALLTDAGGRPLPNRPLTVTSAVSPPSHAVKNVTTNASGSVLATFPVDSDLPGGVYEDAIVATFDDDDAFAAASAQSDTTVIATPPLSWLQPANITYGTPLGPDQLRATSTLPGTYVYSPAEGTVLDAGVHMLSVTFTPDSEYYAARTLQTMILVLKATPIVEISSAPVWYTGYPRPATVVVHGVGSDELNPFTVLYNGSASAPVNAGTYPLQVQYAGSTNYQSVNSTGSFVVSKATPIMGAFGDITETYDGQPHGISVNVAGVTGEWLTPVIVTYNGSTDTPVNAGVYAIEARYNGSANYNEVSHTATLTILKAAPYLTWPDPGGITYGTALGAAQLNATANVAGAFTYSPGAGTVLNAGAHALTASFTPADEVNYEAAAANRSIAVAKANPQVTWYAPASIVYGTPLSAAQLNATANVPGTFSYSPAAGAVLTAGSQTLSVTFTPDDAANYNGGSANVSLTVTKAASTISWSNPANIVYGTALGASQLNATANVAGTFSYSPAPGAVLTAGPQTLSVTFTPDDAANYNGGSENVSLTVTKAASTISWSNPADIVYGTALGGSQLNATANVAGTFSYSPASGTVPDAGSHALSVTFTPDDAANYNGASANVSLTVNKAASTISWSNPADIVYGAALGGSQLNATANVPGTFNYSPASGSVLNAGAQTLSVTFTPDDAANYNGASANVSLTVTKAASTIGWANPADIVYGTALGGSQLNATANVTGTFSYSPASGTVLTAGSHTLSVTFTPDDAANYNSASANVSLSVTRAASTISWSNPADVVYGTALDGSQLNATANVPGTFGYSPAAGTVLGAGSHTLSVTFTPDDAANYDSASANVSLTVTKAASTISWSNPADIVYGAALGGSQLNATANVPGTFAYSPLAGTVLGAGAHTLSVSFTPDDAANYNTASANVSLTVTKAASTISWSNPADIVYGAALGGSQLNATANVPGTFAYSPLAGTVLGAGAHTLSVSFTPDDAANYNTASANVSLTVNKAASTISWSNPADIVYGAALGGSQLNATANVAGTFSYSPAAGTVLGAGTQTLSVTFTPDDSANYASATANVSIAVAKAAPAITWANPAGVTYGTALSGTQLNATANVNGSFAYSPAAGTVLGAGTHNLSVTFTPADGANYTTAGATVSIGIAPAGLTVQANNAGKVYGQALPAFTASGTGFVNGDSMASLGGTLAFTTSATATSAPGTYPVTPGGVSSPNYSITFAAGTLTVTKAATSLTLTTTPNPSQHNQTVQIRAVVAAVAPGAGTATGTVSFYENGTLLGSATLVNGVATMNKNFKRGTHPLTATYAGSTNFTGSSGAVTHSTQ